jgi:tetratricopeptide (TPR) repeat protein
MVLLGFFASVWAQTPTQAQAQAQAQAEAEIKTAIEAGKLDHARQLVRQQKKKAPADVQWQFMEGVIQAQGGQLDQAIRTFKKITETHPEQSEAYNNLGVLYAAKGQLEESKAFLEKALQTHPSYEAAHRNLSDIRGQLAQQSYAKALQIQPKASIGAPQLTLLGRIGRDANAKAAPAPSTAPTTMAAATPPAPQPTAPTAVAPAASAVALPPASPPEVPKALPTPADTQDIGNAITRWAKAWSNQDMPAYYAAYASNFTPARGVSLAQWKNDRRDRIVNKKSISVDIQQLNIQVKDDTAVARFQQLYASGNLKATSRKTLTMVRQGKDWLIVRESVN